MVFPSPTTYCRLWPMPPRQGSALASTKEKVTVNNHSLISQKPCLRPILVLNTSVITLKVAACSFSRIASRWFLRWPHTPQRTSGDWTENQPLNNTQCLVDLANYQRVCRHICTRTCWGTCSNKTSNPNVHL